MKTYGYLQAENDALRKRVAELEKDATRYQWLKNAPTSLSEQFPRLAAGHWDAHIDAAMKEKP
jgi:hypothetical protein